MEQTIFHMLDHCRFSMMFFLKISVQHSRGFIVHYSQDRLYFSL